MFDFSTLGQMTPEQKVERDAARRREALSREDATRDAGSRKAVTVTLMEEPKTVGLADGRETIVLRGVEAGASNPLKAVFVVPQRISGDAQAEADFDKRLRAIGGGDEMSFAGHWSKRRWKDQAGSDREAWEFKVQHMAEGRHGLEAILEKARVERGEAPVEMEQDRLSAAARAAAAARDRNAMGVR